MRISSLGVFALAVLSLSACAAEPAATELRLADTKSPVQLLRNEAASRVPDEVSATVRESSDLSVACRTVDDDPEGRQRQWQSSITFAIPDHVGIDVAHDIAVSFTDADWTARIAVDDADEYRAVLTKPSSTASIHLDADSSTLEVWTNGPCVDTPGADSDEVTSLE